MWVTAIVLVLASWSHSGSGCTYPNHCALEADLASWVSEILDQVNFAPKYGTPGQAFCFGDRAFPVMIGNNEDDVLMAAAELGSGRIVAVTMDKYVSQFTSIQSDPDYNQLLQNLKVWLSQGGYTDDSCICALDSASDLSCLSDPNIKIVTSRGEEWPSLSDNQQLSQWIRNGGALFHGVKGWVWKRLRTSGMNGTPITEGIGFYRTLIEAGIGYTTGYAYSSNPIPTPHDSQVAAEFLVLNTKIAAELVATISDLDGNAFLDTIFDNLKSSDSQQFPDEVKQVLAQTLQDLATRLESEMEWPQGRVGDETSITVTSGQQMMYKLYFALGSMGLWQSVAPSADLFPGTLSDPPARSTAVVEYTTDRQDYIPTGYYLLPGDNLTIAILDTTDPSWKNFKVLIGSNTDKLYSKTKIKRWPEIARFVNLNEEVTITNNIFGGLVFFSSPGGASVHIKASLSGVIPAPYFNLVDPDASTKWESEKAKPAPWAIVSGLNIFFTVPRSAITDAPDPSSIMQTWDQMVENYYDLMCQPSAKRRKQWFGSDIQISHGYMHAGYPIGAHLDISTPSHIKYFLGENWIKYWAFYHEVGHNMQKKYWTYTGTTEVTVNIFSSNAMENIVGQPVWLNDWLRAKIEGTFVTNWLNNPTFTKLKSNPQAHIFIFAQLLRDFGWSCMKKFFCDYTAIEDDSSKLPSNNQAEMDNWLTRYSNATGYNLAPLFDFWQFPLSSSVYDEVSHLEPYLPDDEITQKIEAVQLVSNVLQNYPSLVMYNPLTSSALNPECANY